jgi:lipoyl(octanoyl) transferase
MQAPRVRWLGRVPYEPTWRAMQRFTYDRTADTCDEIWLLEHDPVFTLGMNAKTEHVLAAGDIPVVRIDRGGQVTYHGPGQLVVYPLIDVRRRNLGVRGFVGALEGAVIDYALGSASRPRAARERPGSTPASASSRASASASAAMAVTTAWRSTSPWTWSPFAASTPAATPAWR